MVSRKGEEIVIKSLNNEKEPFSPAISKGSVYTSGKDFLFAVNYEKQLTYLLDRHGTEFAFSSLHPSFYLDFDKSSNLLFAEDEKAYHIGDVKELMARSLISFEKTWSYAFGRIKDNDETVWVSKSNEVKSEIYLYQAKINNTGNYYMTLPEYLSYSKVGLPIKIFGVGNDSFIIKFQSRKTAFITNKSIKWMREEGVSEIRHVLNIPVQESEQPWLEKIYRIFFESSSIHAHKNQIFVRK